MKPLSSLLAALDGDVDAQGRVLEACGPSMMATARKRMSAALLATMSPEDVVSAARYRILAEFKHGKLEFAEEQDPWAAFERHCMATVKRTATDAGRRLHLVPRTDDDGAARQPGRESTPSAFARANEIEARVESKVNRLSTQFRVVVRRHLAGQKAPEIAEELRLSKKQVSNRLARALDVLKRQLRGFRD